METTIDSLPDDVLLLIFSLLPSSTLPRLSLLCRRWLHLASQTLTRLSLLAPQEIHPHIPRLLQRFPNLTHLSLRSPRHSPSISDDSFRLIASLTPGLQRLSLRSLRHLSESSLESLPLHCAMLRKLSLSSCPFGQRSVEFVLSRCPRLEHLSLKRLRGLKSSIPGSNIDDDNNKVLCTSVVSPLRSILLKELYNAQVLTPLIAGCTGLRSVRIVRCCGEWDSFLEEVAARVVGVVEVHLEKLQVSDRGLFAVSCFKDLEVLHLVKTPECTDAGVIAVAERCRKLRRIHIDGWRTNRIGDYGLLAIARGCADLQELVLIGVNPTVLSVEFIASDCRKLERLTLCGCESFGDAELVCLAVRSNSLKKLCIKGCPITDCGLETLAEGCPKLTKLKLKRCPGVTVGGVEWLMVARGGSLSVSLDRIELQEQDASMSDGGVHDVLDDIPELTEDLAAIDLPSSSNGRHSLPKAGNFLTSTLRRWSSDNSRQS